MSYVAPSGDSIGFVFTPGGYAPPEGGSVGFVFGEAGLTVFGFGSGDILITGDGAGAGLTGFGFGSGDILITGNGFGSHFLRVSGEASIAFSLAAAARQFSRVSISNPSPQRASPVAFGSGRSKMSRMSRQNAL